jgi:hypothetical protein
MSLLESKRVCDNLKIFSINIAPSFGDGQLMITNSYANKKPYKYYLNVNDSSNVFSIKTDQGNANITNLLSFANGNIDLHNQVLINAKSSNIPNSLVTRQTLTDSYNDLLSKHNDLLAKHNALELRINAMESKFTSNIATLHQFAGIMNEAIAIDGYYYTGQYINL